MLDPRWLSASLYRVLRHGRGPAGGDTLLRARVAELLPAEPEAIHLFLLELMRRADLLVPLDDDDQRWLVPQWLPRAMPRLLPWPDEGRGATRLRYQYPVVPEGLLPRLIARTAPLSDGLPRWAEGVVMQLGDALALARLDAHDRRIDVAVHGPQKAHKELLGIVRANLQTMHADLPGLEVVESIEVVPRAFTPVETLESDARDARPSGVPTPEGTVMVDAAEQLDRLSQKAPYPEGRRRARVFVSYASRDRRHLQELHLRLQALKRTYGLVEVWTDGLLMAGSDWDATIRHELNQADVVLLLVSESFVASDYIQDVELMRALERARAGKCLLVPIILEKVHAWQSLPFGSRNALPPKGVPIRDHSPHSNGWFKVCEGLAVAISSLALS